jgi:hypothetical protein
MPGSAALVRRGYEAINSPDPERLAELLDEGASWHTPGLSPLAGDAIGRDAVLGQFGRYAGETGGTFRADLQRVLTDEDGRVLGIHRNTAVRNGRSLDVYCCVVFELRDGRIVDGREHFHDLGAWDAFWS